MTYRSIIGYPFAPVTCAIVCLLFHTAKSPVNAGFVYESATLGTTGISGGLTLGNPFAIGSWFTLTSATRVTAMGGQTSISNSPAENDSV